MSIIEEKVIPTNSLNAADLVRLSLPAHLHGSFDALYRSIFAQMLAGQMSGLNHDSQMQLQSEAAQRAANALNNL